MHPNPLLDRLGYDADARLVIFHADDLGMSHGANQAFLELLEAGMVRCGSVMAPCPWAPEILHHAAAHPWVDLGVHLTLTSEWPRYRWGPLSTRQENSGLLDPEGYLWPTVEALLEHVNLAAALRELEIQIDQVLRFGVSPTHLDNHMGFATDPRLLEIYVQLGLDHGLPVLLPRQVDAVMADMGLAPDDPEAWERRIRELEERGMALVDWFRITPSHVPVGSDEERAALYESILGQLLPGITYFSLHPNAPGDMEVLSPEWAAWRVFEYRYFQSERLRRFLDAQGIVPIGYRELTARTP